MAFDFAVSTNDRTLARPERSCRPWRELQPLPPGCTLLPGADPPDSRPGTAGLVWTSNGGGHVPWVLLKQLGTEGDKETPFLSRLPLAVIGCYRDLFEMLNSGCKICPESASVSLFTDNAL